MPPKRKKPLASGGQPLGEPDRHFRSLLGRLSQFQGRGSYTDLILRAEDGEVECHKALLAPFSPLLRGLFRISEERQAADVTAISLAEVRVRPLRDLVTFVYSGDLPAARDRGPVAALALHLQLGIVLEEDAKAGGQGAGAGGQVRKETKPVGGGASWNDFIAENGASPPAEAPSAAKKRGRQPGPRKSDVKGNMDIEDEDEKMKTKAAKKRLDVKLKNLTKDKSAEVARYLSLDAVEDATMMEAALRRGGQGGARGRGEDKEAVDRWWNKKADTPRQPEGPKRGRKAGPSPKETKDDGGLANGLLQEDSDGSDGVEILEDSKLAKTPQAPKSMKKRGRKSKADMVAEEASEEKVEPVPSAKKERKKKEVAEPDEYEVERILEKREGGGGVEYLVKWKGWEDEKDRTWEPEGNLKGSEKLIKAFAKEDSAPAEDEEGVALCDICNRIFLSRDSLRTHAKEHKAAKWGKKAKASPRAKAKEEVEAVEVEAPAAAPKTPASGKRKQSGEDQNLDCYNCGKDCKNKAELKHHVLSHFYTEFYAVLPSSKPFSCPVCSNVSRDKISLVRHYAFVHEEIYKYCTKEQLTNTKGGAATPAVEAKEVSDVEEVASDNGGGGGDPFADIADPLDAPRAASPEVPRYRPGPKSKKQKLLLPVEAPKTTAPPPPPPFRLFRDETLDTEEVVDLSDSDDDSPAATKAANPAATFDDIFGSSASKPAPRVPAVVFNKDSDDEGEAFAGVSASVEDLMGDMFD